MSLIEVASERMLSPVHFDLPSDALADLASSGLLASAVDIFEWPHSAGGAHDFDTMGKHHQALHAPPPPPPPPPAPLPVAATRPYETSLKVFRRHLTTTTLPNGTVQVGAEGIISRACYEDWLSTRPRATSEPEKTFQRILTCCVSGTDGRQPFNPDEEDGVLKQLRLKRVWPAFADSDLSIGSKGFRSYGFHEKARLRMSGEIAPESGASKPLKRAKRTGTSSLSGHESPAMAVAAPLAPQDAAPQAAPEPLLSADDAVNFSVSFDWLMTAFNSAVVGEGSDSLLPDDAAAVELTAADLGSALAAFEMRHPGWAAAAIDIARSNVAAVQNGASVKVFGPLASAQDLLSAVPEEQQVRVLRHIAFCVHTARGAETEISCTLLPRNGAAAADEHRLVMLCERASGALVVGAASSATTAAA